MYFVDSTICIYYNINIKRLQKRGESAMSKYFKNVSSFEELKKEFKELLKVNHPDNGGDAEKMKEINVEYDALFSIWKNRVEKETGETVKETADSVRNQFYTQFGWEGRNHNWNRTLKEVAQIVRAYVKEKYPTYKFSVRTEYFSMGKELHVELKESPVEIYKTADELNEDDKKDFFRKTMHNDYWVRDQYTDEEFKAEYNRITEEHGSFYKVLNEVTKSVIDDVDSFVKSYNYSDCDGMIDYFDVDFYYFGCARNNGQNIKIVPKTARIKNKFTAPIKKTAKREETKTEPKKLEKKTEYTYKITKGEDTRDGSELWIVRIVEKLSKDAYIAENKVMKERGGYYSKYKHGFIFRFDPTKILELTA